jgi:VanZ family protein
MDSIKGSVAKKVKTRELCGWHKLAVAFSGALLVGALDEWHQMYLPGREAGLSNFIADVMGSTL